MEKEMIQGSSHAKEEKELMQGGSHARMEQEFLQGGSRAKGEKEIIQGSSRARNQKKGNRFNPKFRRILVFAILEVIVLTGIFAYAYMLRQYNKIQRPEVNIEEVRNANLSIENIQKMEEGYWNIAVFGVDSRDSSVGKGANSDVNIVVSINRATGEIRLVSVFRDTYLKIGDNSYNKINAAYCNGGPEQALKALNENLDLNITEYATFNWKAVATGINILGGVDVELSKAEFYYINSFITETVKGTGIGSVQLTHAGMNHLDGVQAVAYARLRLMDNDYARTERQRKIIQLCFEKAKQADLKTLNDLLGNMLEMVATNLTWQDGIDAIADISKYSIGETGGFPFARGEGSVGKRGDCVIPQTLESNVRELHTFLFDEEYEPSEGVKEISNQISVKTGMYNEGTSVGHVSTTGYIPAATKPAAQPETAGSAQGGEGTPESTVDSPEKPTAESVAKKVPIEAEENVEYAISRDGYLICVDQVDPSGNKYYKYVLDDNGKRIKMVETDAQGNLVYLYETDENGNFTFGGKEEEGPGSSAEGSSEESTYETSDKDGKPIIRETENPIGPGAGAPGNSSESTRGNSPDSTRESTRETTKETTGNAEGPVPSESSSLAPGNPGTEGPSPENPQPQSVENVPGGNSRSTGNPSESPTAPAPPFETRPDDDNAPKPMDQGPAPGGNGGPGGGNTDVVEALEF